MATCGLSSTLSSALAARVQATQSTCAKLRSSERRLVAARRRLQVQVGKEGLCKSCGVVQSEMHKQHRVGCRVALR